jgi:hypothetical protein
LWHGHSFIFQNVELMALWLVIFSNFFKLQICIKFQTWINIFMLGYDSLIFVLVYWQLICKVTTINCTNDRKNIVKTRTWMCWEMPWV